MPSPLQTWQADIDRIWVERVTDACSWGVFLKLPWVIRIPRHPFRCHYMSWKASYLSCFGSSHYQSGQFSLRDCIEVWGSLLRPLWSVDFRLLWGKWWNIQGAMPVASQVIMTHWRTILPSGWYPSQPCSRSNRYGSYGTVWLTCLDPVVEISVGSFWASAQSEHLVLTPRVCFPSYEKVAGPMYPVPEIRVRPWSLCPRF
jgi:hypothetical protein